MVDPDTMAASFTAFAREAEPKLRNALCAAFGADLGREAAAEAFTHGWWLPRGRFGTVSGGAKTRCFEMVDEPVGAECTP
jgi:hypothetical protein